MNKTTFEAFCQQRRNQIDAVLATALDSQIHAPRLTAAMRYVVLNGGKRLRPLLVYACGEWLALPTPLLDNIACAIEFIHAYSLTHDDLPAMDNDDLRRGLPTCHRAFDEATAMLAGDALQSLAFEMISQPMDPQFCAKQLTAVHALARAAGANGMVAGQMLDLQASAMNDAAYVTQMHQLKTGALLSACIEMPLLMSETSPAIYNILMQFAQHLGLAFQIQDDILDIESTTQQLGKQQGKDIQAHKMTYPARVGMVAAKQKVQQLYDIACDALNTLPISAPHLAALAAYVIAREN